MRARAAAAPLNEQFFGLLLATLAAAASGCFSGSPAEQHYFDQQIQPILNTFCVGNTSPCHRVDNDTGSALGNLDLSSFDSVQKRRDVLRTYGSYPQPLLLLKALPEESVQIPYAGRLLASEIKHGGGKPISITSDAYYKLKDWIDNGANRDGQAPIPKPHQGVGDCNKALPPPDQRVPVDTSSPAYQMFVSTVQPFLLQSCAYGTCHSSPEADLYLTCGDDDDQLAFNFAQAAGFVAPKGTDVEQSEILLRPLSPLAGGVSHTGGTFIDKRDDQDTSWALLKGWALAVQDNPLMATVESPGEMFFRENVMPKLLQRGCALEGCHSPDGFNDFRLRSGAQGFFAPAALHRNYQTLLTEFMALDSVDVRQSRAVKKNIPAESGGITHRAGPLLLDAVPIETPCPEPFDATDPAPRAFCVFEEWHRIERGARGTAVSTMAAGDKLPLAFVARPPSGDDLLHFDDYQGQADLELADATVDGAGKITAVGNVRSALSGCKGLAGQDVDVRGPEWSYDGNKLIFAARAGAASGLDLWLLDLAAGSCTRLTQDDGRMTGNGVRVHNFDPVFAPDGSVVFASTRTGTWTLKTFQPNSDLFRVGPDLDFSNPQQMTFLLNAELSPAFMQDGRVTFTAEKASADFYQLAGRRMNWDLTDYHPLLAQRAQSVDTRSGEVHPSVDYQQATEIREGLDRNFLVILSDEGAKGGGGALATFNRSIGPFQADRTEVTFLRSLVIVDPAATGKDGTTGVYRSPFSLPNGEILASYDGAVSQPSSQSPKFELVAVDASTGGRRVLLADGTLSYVEAALGYKRAERTLFSNHVQLVFGGASGADTGSSAVMHFPDLPMLATLLGANLRRGRNVDAMDKAVALRVYQENPPAMPNPPTGVMGSENVYTDRKPLGSAAFEADHSLKLYVPSGVPLILELIDKAGKPVLTMTEEHQVTAGEYITPGPPRALFNPICGGCHGSVSGSDLDIAVSADALTGASVSMSRDPKIVPKQLQ